VTARENETDTTTPPTVAGVDKAGWRAELLAGRRRRSPIAIADARRRIAAHLAPLGGPGGTVCAYLPLPTEPLDPDLPAELARRGARVLVPIAARDAPLDWCAWAPGATRRGSFGIREPLGQVLGADAIADAGVILIPALAVDRRGTRLGRGGGHYDRSLARDDIAGRLIAVIFDDEVVDTLPRALLDRPVTEVVTPTGGIRRLGSS
jgi:5-formyltetrahydrofolate cyclo-ligase